VIQRGKAADLVVFDPSTIADRSTYMDPLLRPAGVRDVIVGGRPVVREGELTGERPGVVLRPA
jgi:N-acyl-D-aspartate/D-glutamate deacylase